jgi:hypothetical protein
MALHLPSEIVVERFLPTVRAMLAVELHERGLTQQEIADRLGVTQAAVSKYVSGEPTLEPRVAEDRRTRRTVERIADGFADGEMDDYEALSELLALVREFEDRGPICELHEEAMPELQGLGCDLCVRGEDGAVLAEQRVLESVRKAARIVANTPAVVAHIPNVGTNIGMALPEASDPLEVAAIPGRVHDLRGRVNVPSNPEFGASEHVARTVLTAMDADPTRRAAINLATSDDLLERVRAAGVDPLEFDAAYEDRAAHLAERFAERGGVPRVLYHTGDFGIEPITYVLGETAVDAAEFILELIGDE